MKLLSPEIKIFEVDSGINKPEFAGSWSRLSKRVLDNKEVADERMKLAAPAYQADRRGIQPTCP